MALVEGVAGLLHLVEMVLRPAAERPERLGQGGAQRRELVLNPRRHLGADMSGVDLLTVVVGAIVEVSLFSENGDAEDAFWGTAA